MSKKIIMNAYNTPNPPSVLKRDRNLKHTASSSKGNRIQQNTQKTTTQNTRRKVTEDLLQILKYLDPKGLLKA